MHGVAGAQVFDFLVLLALAVPPIELRTCTPCHAAARDDHIDQHEQEVAHESDRAPHEKAVRRTMRRIDVVHDGPDPLHGCIAATTGAGCRRRAEQIHVRSEGAKQEEDKWGKQHERYRTTCESSVVIHGRYEETAHDRRARLATALL